MTSLSIYLDSKEEKQGGGGGEEEWGRKQEKVGKLKMSITVQLCRENCQQPGTCAFNVKPLVSKNKSEAAHAPVSDREKGHNEAAPHTTYTQQSEGCYFFGFLV